MFTPSSRDALLERLVATASADPAVTAAALVGSLAANRVDEWSDIDLALRLAADADEAGVVEAWTREFYEHHGAVAHTDVHAAGARYRVFLLDDTLQVDVSFWPDELFAARGPTFRLLFGAAHEPADVSPPAAVDAIGLAWLYALHVRSSVARGRPWQSIYMLGAMRDSVVRLACVVRGLPASEGRGVDALPDSVTAALAATLPSSPDPADVVPAMAVLTRLLLTETAAVDGVLAERLHGPLHEILRTTVARSR